MTRSSLPVRRGGKFPWPDVPLFDDDNKRIRARAYGVNLATKDRVVVYVEANQFLFDIVVVRDGHGYETLLMERGKDPDPMLDWDEFTDPWGIRAAAMVAAMVAFGVPGALDLSLMTWDDLFSPDLAVMLPGARA